MKTHKCVWLLAIAVLASPVLEPGSARADRLPSIQQTELLLDNDPWRPDTKDPGRALADRGESTLDDASRSVVREPIQRQTWYQMLLRAIQLRVFWGIWR